MKVNDYESTQIDIYQCIKITGTSCEDTSITMTVDVSQLEMPENSYGCVPVLLVAVVALSKQHL